MRAFGRHYDTAAGSIERLRGRNTSMIRKMVKEFDKGNDCKLIVEYLANVAHLWCVMMDGCTISPSLDASYAAMCIIPATFESSRLPCRTASARR